MEAVGLLDAPAARPSDPPTRPIRADRARNRRGAVALIDYPKLTVSRAREQFRVLALWRPVTEGARQADFMPVETLLCLAASFRVNHRRYGGSREGIAGDPLTSTHCLSGTASWTRRHSRSPLRVRHPPRLDRRRHAGIPPAKRRQHLAGPPADDLGPGNHRRRQLLSPRRDPLPRPPPRHPPHQRVGKARGPRRFRGPIGPPIRSLLFSVIPNGPGRLINHTATSCPKVNQSRGTSVRRHARSLIGHKLKFAYY